MHVYCPPPRHLRPQIATSPADHLVDCRIGTRQNQIAQLRHLLLRQKRRTTRALAGLQTTNPLDVVTVNPVAQRLPVHPVQFRRRLARPSFHHQRPGQQTADLRAVARFGRSRPQRRRIMLRPRDCHCRAHAPSPLRTDGSRHRIRGSDICISWRVNLNTGWYYTALGILRTPVLKVATGVTEAAVLHLRSLLARLRLANREFRQAQRKLDELCAALTQTEAGATPLSDAAILASLPGVGKTTLASLLTEASGPLSRRDYAALRTLSGVAPVTKRGGKTCIVVMRYAAHVRLRQAVFHWARGAVQTDPQSQRRYQAFRARGHSYGGALRGVADRLLGIACVLLRRRDLFNPQYGDATATVSIRTSFGPAAADSF